MENNKAAEAASNSAGGATNGQTMNSNGGANPDPSTIPNPKLGMAPLSSELAVAAASNNVPAESHQSPNPPPPVQPTDSQSKIPLTADPPRPDPAATGPAQIPMVPVTSEPEQVPQANDSLPSLPDSTALPPNPTLTVDLAEQLHRPNPNPAPSDPPPVDPPTEIGSHPPHADNIPEEKS